MLKHEAIKPGDSRSEKQHETASACKYAAGKSCGCCVQNDTNKTVKKLECQEILDGWGCQKD